MTISTASLAFMGLTVAICFGGLPVYWILVKDRVKVKTAVLGLACYFVFVLILQGMIQSLILKDTITDNLFYVVFVCLSTVIFEEGSRFLIFKYYMNRQYETAEAALGFGMGWILPQLLVGGITALMNAAMAYYVNKNGLEAFLSTVSADSVESLRTTIETIAATAPSYYFFSGIDRMSFAILEIGISVLLWYSATREGYFYLLPVAVAANALYALASSLYQTGVWNSIAQIEMLSMAISIAVGYYAYKLFTKLDGGYKFKADRLRARGRR